ncbi:MAG: hypothetical protein EBU90_23360 [Proteobacteria bacterium]|nr:hypothetical protein [Pseudomonadota bacterium]
MSPQARKLQKQFEKARIQLQGVPTKKIEKTLSSIAANLEMLKGLSTTIVSLPEYQKVQMLYRVLTLVIRKRNGLFLDFEDMAQRKPLTLSAQTRNSRLSVL